MDPIIVTPRLKLSLVTNAEKGSQELEWVHKLRSNEQAMFWGITGVDKTMEDSEKSVKGYLPTKGAYRILYAVHKILEPNSDPATPETQTTSQAEPPTELLGIITLRSLGSSSLPLPESFTLPASAASTILTVELSYMFLPAAWGKGYATESVKAVLEASKTAKSFWEPFAKVYVRVLVNEENPASRKVMDKTGMTYRGVYEWKGDAVFLAGEWREEGNIHIYGSHLLE